MSSHEQYFSSEAHRDLRIKTMLKDIESDEAENGFVHDHLPYSDLSEWIPENSLIAEADKAFDVYRLNDILSLSFLSYRMHDAAFKLSINDTFRHTRYDHSLVVTMVMDKILKRNKVSPDTYALGITAGLTHDLATPAGGDAVKFLDPYNLHEETHWDEMLNDKSISFLEKHALSPDAIKEVIANEGMLGEVLDLADRLTYTAKDVEALIDSKPFIIPASSDIQHTVEKNTQFGNLYRDIIIDPATNRPYSNDPNRLGDVLKLRALMHYNLYSNPVSAGRDWVIAKFVEPYYSPDSPTPEKPITPTLLRQWTDKNLLGFLSERYQLSNDPTSFFYNDLSFWSPSHLSFATHEEAEKEKSLMEHDPEIVVLDTIDRKRFKTGEHYLTKDDHGDIVTFKEAKPQEAELLDSIAQATEKTHLFYIDQSDQSSVGKIIRRERSRGVLKY